MNYKINFLYRVNNEKKSISFYKGIENEDIKSEVNTVDVENGSVLNISILPKKEITMEKVYMTYLYDYNHDSRVFLNGYQSWTDSREFRINESVRGISKIVPKSVIRKNHLDMYGDYTFKKYSRKSGELHGFTYSYIRNGLYFDFIGSLTERNGYTIITHHTNDGEILIEKECENIKISDKYDIFNLCFLRGNEDEVFDRYFELMHIKKPKVKPMTGYTSWYNHYQNISERVIIDNLNSMKCSHKKLDIFQIDDGYQTAVGDWLSIDKEKFPRGLKTVVDSIKISNMMPGLWLAPFACEYKSEIVTKHPEWILKNEDGSYVSGGCNWGGYYALDIYNEELREYLKKVFDKVLNEWGFDLVKLDFLYATAIIPRKNKSRGEIMCDAMNFLRECVGDKLILGCGVPLGPAFGKVDFCRIGCDIGLDYDDKWHMRLLHRERVSTKNAITNSIGRRQLDKRAFLNDPDVFLLRDDNIELTDEQKKTLALVNHIFGSLLFTSDNIKDYNEEQQEIFDKATEVDSVKVIYVDQDENLDTHVIYEENGIEKTIVIDIQNGKLK